MALELKPVRVLEPGDEPLLEAFCARYPDTTLFLRSNLLEAGIVDRGEPYQGTYSAYIDSGGIQAVAGHFWNGMVIFEAPDMLHRVVTDAVWKSGRAVKGLIARHDQVVKARALFGLQRAETTMDSKEILFGLDLGKLRAPAAPADRALRCRRATPADRAHLARWRVAYDREALGAEDTPELRALSEQNTLRAIESARLWVLERAGEIVAMTAFNARTPEAVQVGGVYTPPELRSQGLARAAVAGSLIEAREHGATRSILFTQEGNKPAIACYERLGYEALGDYGLVLFKDEHHMTL